MTKIVDMGGYEMHHPPEKLKSKVSTSGALTIAEIEKRAAKNMETLTEQFLDGLSNSILAVNDALETIIQGQGTAATQEIIFHHVHDMKGMGGSFNYPIVGTIGAALSDLTNPKVELSALKMPLIKAHMDVLRWIVDHKIKTDNDPRAEPLLAELERVKSSY